MTQLSSLNDKSAYFRIYFILLALVCFGVIWWLASYEISRSRVEYLNVAERTAIFQAQAFAENTLSIIKRVDEILLDLRDRWVGDYKQFATFVQRRQSYTSDVTFQIATIGADGRLSYSNLAPATNRVDLSDREHFRVHRDREVDQLFISHPVKGKVSGKWSVQFTRPILNNGAFDGVMVVSVSPDTFGAFRDKLNLGVESIITMVKDTGEILSRSPDNDSSMGKTLTGTPYLAASPPLTGTFHRKAQVDGVERLYGFYRLQDYGINFVVGQPFNEVLKPWEEYRNTVMSIAALATGTAALFLSLLYRSFAERRIVIKRLSESQSMLRSAIDTIGEAFVIYDSEDKLAYCNQQYKDYYQQSADLLIPGKSFEEIIRKGAERGQYKEAEGRIEEWVAKRLTAHQSGNTELIQPLSDNRYLRIRERKTPEGFIVGFRIDITELYKAKEAAEAANLAKSQFLATMSHEIRTPMNGILGMAQLLLMDDVSKAERQDFARIILNSGQTLLTLLNDILDLSKIEAGRLELEYSMIDPVQIINETAQLFHEAASAKGLDLVAHWEGVSKHYLADAHRIRQMLSNLTGNAIKFTTQGTVSILAKEVERSEGKALLEFSVSDTGVGIEKDKLALLFKPFSQADSTITRQFGGTGLGLSIVRSLAENMGGEVGVESTTGEGSRFWFRIRVDLVKEGIDLRSSARTNEAMAVSSKQLTGNILVVEDNLTNQKVIQALLNKLGLSCRVASDGRAGVAAVQQDSTIDLILMDIQMPVMNGYEATKEIRAWEGGTQQAHRPIIALTANAFDTDRQECLAAGMSDFLSKPISLDKLTLALQRWLQFRG